MFGKSHNDMPIKFSGTCTYGHFGKRTGQGIHPLIIIKSTRNLMGIQLSDFSCTKLIFWPEMLT